jgi:hypothetical protein
MLPATVRVTVAVPRFRERWPKQPWLYPLTDLRSQGAPECEVFVGASVLLALHVRDVDGGTQGMVAVRWVNGMPVSLLIPEDGLTAAVVKHVPNFDERDF